MMEYLYQRIRWTAQGRGPVDDDIGQIRGISRIAGMSERAAGGVGELAGEGVEQMDADGLLAFAVGNEHAVRIAEASRLVAAAHWADLHGVLVAPLRLSPQSSTCLRSRPGAERLVHLGGDGTPAVSEFAAAELGPCLQMTVTSAERLIGDALDLRHRLPRVWTQVRRGRVPAWTARKIAQRCHQLSASAAAEVDEAICGPGDDGGPLTHLPWARLIRRLDAAILRADPPAALDEATRLRREQGVFVDREGHLGYGSAFVRAPAPVIAAFDDAVTRLAGALHTIEPSDSSVDERRAQAVGLLAQPDLALTVLDQARQIHTDPTRADRLPPIVTGRTVIYLHLSADSLANQAADQPDAIGVARVEGIGPVLTRQLTELVGRHDITVKPVIDLNDAISIDAYEVPDRLRERGILRTPADTFPYAPNTSRAGDMDHTQAYLPPGQGGSSGQTCDANLSRMTRHTHRIKTHAGCKVRHLHSGCLLWTSPHGYGYLVDAHGTTPLGQVVWGNRSLDR
jgi:hypothetical protein